MIAKVTEREVEVATLRAEAKAAMDTVESFKSQLEDVSDNNNYRY
jgi:hypothetical protein